MKLTLVLGTVFYTGFLFASNEEIKLNNKIENATVFLQGAQVKRIATFNASVGFSDLVFENVSPILDANTIQVSGKGEFVILNVQKDIKYPKPDEVKLPDEISKKISLLSDSLEFFQFNIDNNQAQISTLELQKNLITKNKIMNGESKSDSLELFQNAMEYLKKKLFEINKDLIELKKESRRLNNIQIAMQKRLTELQNYHSTKKEKSLEGPIHRVVVSIQCTKALTGGKISINYFVSDAGWTPSYDIRAENTTSPISLTYKARLYQNTGEKWENVKLTVSTYQANRNTVKPILPVWYLNYYNPPRPLSSESYQKHNGSLSLVEPAEFAKREKKLAEIDDADISSMYASMVETRTNVEYSMEIPFNIESGASAQTFAIHQENLKSEYYHYLVPKLEKEAFLLAQISDWEELNLLPADANIYFEGTLVGKTIINPNILTDTLELAMGRDYRVICEKKAIKDKDKNNIIGSNRIKNAVYEITVRNNRSEGINRIVIEDQIPVSKIEDIKVEVNEISKADYNKLTGMLTWQIKLASKEAKKISLSYTVKYDKDKLMGNL